MKLVSYCSAAMLALILSGTALAGQDHRREGYRNGGHHNGGHHDNGYRGEHGQARQYHQQPHQPRHQQQYRHAPNHHRAPQVVVHKHYHPAPPPRQRFYYGQRLPRGYGVPVAAHHRHRLPRRHGHEWRRAGSDLILISISTGVVREILYGYRY